MQRVFVRRLITVLSVFLAFGAGVAFLEGKVSGRCSNQETKQSSKAEFKTLEGAISKFLFARDEVVHGLLLGDGTRVLWPEEITFTFTKIVNIGDKVKVSGWVRKSAAGEINMEVVTLTNLATDKTATNDKAPAPPAKNEKKTDR
jgi:hypothetical protein